MEFHEQLKELRKNKGVTQAEVAQILGVEQSTYAHYESGRRTPDLERLRRLAEYYRLTDELLGVTRGRHFPAFYGKTYVFPVLYEHPLIELKRIYPTKQKLAVELFEVLHPDERVISAMLFGSSITMRCNSESDTDIAVRLSQNACTRETKNEISEKIMEVCDWKADIIWFDSLSAGEKIYHDICKGVQIA